MDQKVLYLGDTALGRAASYLAGILDHERVVFDYVPSDRKFTDELLASKVKAIVISDYPSIRFSKLQLLNIAKRVSGGMGLIMIGGWESFTGCAGGYNKTVLADVLPVRMSEQDDRVNYYAPCVIKQNISHPIVDSVPFKQHPACIAGYNRVEAKATAQIILSVGKYRITEAEAEFDFEREQMDPLLIASEHGKGRVLAYAGDVAPHWAGGLVDWGDKRMTLKASGADEVEVGNWYIRFFSNLVHWVCQ